ncbi:UNVERIFIED_CONTAM: hypothetical protein GTU68_055020 [Idotea baltica]|nr:hypothetical protein [Idotea baltica]
MSEQNTQEPASTIGKDLAAGLIVFLVALPLCLGIALASGADPISGLISGIVGGLVVAAISGSHTSVSGPAAGLTTIVGAQIAGLGSFEAFLLAVAIAGIIQIGFGIAKGGALSLETLLNVEAIDKLDPAKRDSPSSRELIAQGCGNIVCGMVGGLPVTSVVVRGSVNIGAGAKTKLSAIFHGALLLLSVALLPQYMSMIPLSALAAVLLVTGFKLASPALFKQMWNEGRYQFLPFIITVLAIVLSNLLIGILIGLAVSVLFILNSNLRSPIRRVVNTDLAGDVTRIELPNQVSFLNRAALDRLLNEATSDSNLLIDASDSDYIDPDILSLIRDFKDNVAPARCISVNLKGFRSKYTLQDETQFSVHATQEIQNQMSAHQVVDLLKAGNTRFATGERINRDLGRQVNATAAGQNPLAAILSCIDSRVPTELVFDLGVGDIFSVRVAGNVIGTKSLASLEYAVGVAGVKVVLVLGHTRCGAVTSSIELHASGTDAMSATGCEHLQSIVDEIIPSITKSHEKPFGSLSAEERDTLIDQTAAANVLHTADLVLSRSKVIRDAVEKGRAMVVAAMYDVRTGQIDFLNEK